MTHYVALIEGESGAYGVSFPDAPGCTAMAATLDDAYAGAVEALREWMADRASAGLAPPQARGLDAIRDAGELEAASVPLLVPLLLDSGRSVRVNVSLDAGLVAAIDDAARGRGLTRSAFLGSAARDKIATRS